MRRRLVVLAAVVGLVIASSAMAGHHSWDFTELYSNATGQLQFIEMSCPADGEAGLAGWTVTNGSNTLNFATSLPSSSTAGKTVLIATSGFGSLPGGVTPDYIIPGNFFSTGGGTLTYAGGADVWAYGAVPTNGVLSLQRNGSTATNSPRNFAGTTGSVNGAVTAPLIGSWGLVLLLGSFLLIASGVLRRRRETAA
jgi:serralysin